MIKACDILAELDCAVSATRKTFPQAKDEREMIFLDDAYQVLAGFRAYVRSDAFRLKVESNKKGVHK